MNKYNYFALGAAVLASLVSCSNSEVAEELDNQYIVKTIEVSSSEEATRLSIDGDPYKGLQAVKWDENDQLSVWCGSGASGLLQFDCSGTPNDNIHTFVCQKFPQIYDGSRMIVAYPRSNGHEYSYENGDYVTLHVPSLQTAVNGSFDPLAAVMVGVNEDGGKKTTTYLSQVCGFLKFELKQKAKRVTLRAFDKEGKNYAPCGRIKVSPKGQGFNVVSTSIDENNNTITLNPAAGSTEIAVGTYYIAVFPSSSYGKFLVDVNYGKDVNDKDIVVSGEIPSITIGSHVVYNLGAVPVPKN